MKIIVPVKPVADPDNANKITVINSGRELDFNNLEIKPNPFDEYALEAALRILELSVNSGRLRGEIVLVTVGDSSSVKQIRQSLAMGADRAVLIEIPDRELDALLVAKLLSKVAEKESADLIIMGKQAVDGDSNQVAQMSSELLGWPVISSAGNIEITENLDQMIIKREVDGGVVLVKTSFPAVVSVDLRVVLPDGVNNHVATDGNYSEGPRFATLKNVMRAKRKKIDILTPQDLGIEPALSAKTVSFTLPKKRKQGIFVESAAELVKILKEAGTL